jgi:hypothetical protein
MAGFRHNRHSPRCPLGKGRSVAAVCAGSMTTVGETPLSPPTRCCGSQMGHQGVHVLHAAQAVAAGAQLDVAVAAVGHEAVDRDPQRLLGAHRLAVEREALHPLARRRAGQPAVGQPGRRRQERRAGAAGGLLLLQQRLELHAGQGHHHQAVAEGLHGEGVAIGDGARRRAAAGQVGAQPPGFISASWAPPWSGARVAASWASATRRPAALSVRPRRSKLPPMRPTGRCARGAAAWAYRRHGLLHGGHRPRLAQRVGPGRRLGRQQALARSGVGAVVEHRQVAAAGGGAVHLAGAGVDHQVGHRHGTPEAQRLHHRPAVDQAVVALVGVGGQDQVDLLADALGHAPHVAAPAGAGGVVPVGGLAGGAGLAALVHQHHQGLHALGVQCGGGAVDGVGLVGETQPGHARGHHDGRRAARDGTDEAHPHAPHRRHPGGRQQRLAAGQHIGGQHREAGARVGRQGLTAHDTVGDSAHSAHSRRAARAAARGAGVELMVADHRHVHAHLVEHLHRALVAEQGRHQRRGTDHVAGGGQHAVGRALAQRLHQAGQGRRAAGRHPLRRRGLASGRAG